MIDLDTITVLKPSEKPLYGKGKWERLVDRIDNGGSVVLPTMNQAISLQRAARLARFKSSRMFTMTGDYQVWVYKK